MKKVPPYETENMKEQFSDSEQKIIQLKEELEKERDEKQSSLRHVEKLKKEIEDLKKQTECLNERTKHLNEQTKHLRKENKYLKKQLAQFQGSAPFLASSDKNSEAGGVPSSKTYYRRNRQECTKKTNSQLPFFVC
jgi:predicted  nucleic acid-binding Zn-ribbon protein